MNNPNDVFLWSCKLHENERRQFWTRKKFRALKNATKSWDINHCL